LAAASVILLEVGDPEGAAKVQGFADRVLERTGAVPDKLFIQMSSEVKERTRGAVPREVYEEAYRVGKTITLGLVLDLLVGLNLSDPKSEPLPQGFHAEAR
jgi:hypothetical protein